MSLRQPVYCKIYRENETTKTCYQDPDFQLPGYYRCSIHTGKLDIEKDVTHCATECFVIDPDTNKRYAKKIHQINNDKPYRACEQVNKNSCVNNGMVWCGNDQTASEDEKLLVNVKCHVQTAINQFAWTIPTMLEPPQGLDMPLPVNDSNTCKKQTDMKASCKEKPNKYWCEGTNRARIIVTTAGEVNVWDSTTLSYTMKTEQFFICKRRGWSL